MEPVAKGDHKGGLEADSELIRMGKSWVQRGVATPNMAAKGSMAFRTPPFR
jgi:hypothetical protein